MPLHIRLLALMALLLGGCALPPRPENLLLEAASSSTSIPPATLVTDGGFCVALNEQGRLLTQPCDQEPNQLFIWDAGALLLAQGCLIATGTDGLVVGGCENDSHQWQWQGDRLFNRQVSLCLDVAGRRHRSAVPLRLAECYGGANQSFTWTPTGSLLDRLGLPGLSG